MLYNLLKLSHVLAIIIWIGGMFFAHFFLRPVAQEVLPPPERQRLMHRVLGRFFQFILALATWAVVSGAWMIGRVAKDTVQSGGQFQMPVVWMVMAALGLLMWAIFGHIRFALYKRLTQAVSGGDWPAGGAVLAQIKNWIAVNLTLGFIIIVVVYLL
ncbi:MAG: hypothetical protein RLZZ612_451 [Pseudomonadota bacterium]|jgi:uncharacterized membrane protein